MSGTIRKTLMLAACAAVACAWAAGARARQQQQQQQQQRPAPRVGVPGPIKAPSAQDAARILNTRRVVVAGRGADEKAKALAEALGRAGLPAAHTLTPGASLKLTVAAPASGDTHLLFFKPHAVNFSNGLAQFAAAENWSEGSVWVKFKHPAPGRYLFDFALDEDATYSQNVVYRFSNMFGKINQTSQTTPIPGHALTHVSFVVDLPDAEERVFIFHADNGFVFYQCEITPFK